MYDFTTRVDRRGTGSSKWAAMDALDPNVPAGIVPLSVADMEFVEAPQVAEALERTARTAILGYTAPTPSYFDAVVSWQRERHGWDAQPEWIALAPGVVPALGTAVRAFTAPGDGVVVMPPVYHPFRITVENAGRRVVENPLILGEGLRYEIDFAGLEELCRDPHTTMILLCSPHNPVGRVWTADELARIVRICCDHGVFICCDEIHNDLIMPGYEHIVIARVMNADELANCMVCTAPSKTFNLAGLKCSNIFIPDPDRKALFERTAKVESGFSLLNALAYPVCEAVYREGAPWLDEAIEVIAGNHRLMKDFCAERLPMLDVFPLEGTYLQWVDCRGLGMGPEELERFMTREALLFLDEGTLFGMGGAGFERFNLACPQEVLREALERLDAAVRRRLV